ncbi:MAG TPA: DUF1344 domain-containing protein [Hyphomicrobium sp.]|nr:DUF1344 domain-containing protein [Hyphomicrobium sp.]
MNSFLKLSVVALAASVAAGSAMAATAQKPVAPAHSAKVHHAHAAKIQHRTVGKIARINAKHNTLTINHRVYRMTPQLASASLKAGQKVQITYTKGRGHRMIEKISPVSA